MKCPDCELLEQKQRNYELAKKMVNLHKENIVFFKAKNGYYRAERQSTFDPTSGTILEVLPYRRYTTKKL